MRQISGNYPVTGPFCYAARCRILKVKVTFFSLLKCNKNICEVNAQNELLKAARRSVLKDLVNSAGTVNRSLIVRVAKRLSKLKKYFCWSLSINCIRLCPNYSNNISTSCKMQLAETRISGIRNPISGQNNYPFHH